jgi:hypothetical protein
MKFLKVDQYVFLLEALKLHGRYIGKQPINDELQNRMLQIKKIKTKKIVNRY